MFLPSFINEAMLTPPVIFELEKRIWTQEDFKDMGWHDATIYGLNFEKSEGAWTADLLFDIDYIFKWVDPIPPDPFFTFWLAPCTLSFKEAFALQIDINTTDYSLEGFEIADLHLLKKEPHPSGAFTYYWNIELQTGAIKFQSQGYRQIVRQKPQYVRGQTLDLIVRGGINFGQTPYL